MLKLRGEFWQKLREIRVENLIFIDEAGVNLAMVRLYARALKGKRAYGTRPQKRGKNVSMVSAITCRKVLTFFNVLGAIDRITFEAFIVRKLVSRSSEINSEPCVGGSVMQQGLSMLTVRCLFMSLYLLIIDLTTLEKRGKFKEFENLIS